MIFIFRIVESAPICLPAGDIFPDIPEKSYKDKIGAIIGVGALWDQYKSCTTTIGGPNPFQNCKFPFFGPKPKHFKFQPINVGCVTSTPTPSSESLLCRKFHAKVSH